jgi:hypothetical protein
VAASRKAAKRSARPRTKKRPESPAADQGAAARVKQAFARTLAGLAAAETELVESVLARFNIPTRQEIQELVRKVDELSRKIDRISR